MDIEKFLRLSIEKNKEEASMFLMEERSRRIARLAKDNGLPCRFQKKTFDNYDKSKNTKALNTCLAFVSNFPHTKGILLLGGVGLGKTHLAAAVVNNLNKNLYSTYFGNVMDIINFVKSTYNRSSNLSEVEAINIMTESMDLLVIDDLGKENNTEHNLALLYNIINKLYENEKPIIITTNYGASDLNHKLGERGKAIVSRISSICIPVSLTGQDWRIHNERSF